jgi:SPP1 gp7 family putative phage head morphogenesis protein
MKEQTANQQLLENQIKEIDVSAQKTREFKPVGIPVASGIAYNAQLQKLVRAVRKDINTIIIPMVKALEPQYVTDGWSTDIMKVFGNLLGKWTSPEFVSAASKTADKFVKSVNNQNQNRFNRNADRFGIDVFGDSPQLQDLLQASALDNTRLITTIPEQYLNNVQSIVMSNMRSGLRPANIAAQLQNQFGVTQRRATLIARDQTTKLNGEITKTRQNNAGFEFFKWNDSSDSRVRTDHEDIANADIGYGKGVYRWDDPPKNDKGEAIIPGQEIQCRCVAGARTRSQVNAYRESKGLKPV